MTTTIERDATVFHWSDLGLAMRVVDKRGAYATCEWLDAGLPRRRVLRLSELVDGKAGRMDADAVEQRFMPRTIRGVWSDDESEGP